MPRVSCDDGITDESITDEDIADEGIPDEGIQKECLGGCCAVRVAEKRTSDAKGIAPWLFFFLCSRSLNLQGLNALVGVLKYVQNRQIYFLLNDPKYYYIVEFDAVFKPTRIPVGVLKRLQKQLFLFFF